MQGCKQVTENKNAQVLYSTSKLYLSLVLSTNYLQSVSADRKYAWLTQLNSSSTCFHVSQAESMFSMASVKTHVMV